MDFKKIIDHTLLKPEATSKDIANLVSQAKEYGFGHICVNSGWVKYAKELIGDAPVGIVAVVGFPLGANITQIKVHEAELAIRHGADEIDMVINVGKFKEDNFEYVLNEIKQVKKAIGNKILKVIIETALLTQQQISKAAQIVATSGANFVKTSTGFSYRGATLDDIGIIKDAIGDKIAIKAAGGIKTLDDLKLFFEKGATRFGTSSSLAIFGLGKPQGDY
ncbi:deoxyribose-phosphate aldolase [Mesomycoplasma bovoculi]|uniref:Deoxyribose-phosphate aldolase n=1 Tax=Mesomycoplasma bovoculi M165/69 TaxID=743966 RepID=W5USX1_9BACT|nr:deoxyribose-phosphate aldolase [Mesomycoplasma bovoculi]AHH45314.1 Deoxyribose-phosphate aldolase [Mesomycoplasma bovoculi M165/69]